MAVADAALLRGGGHFIIAIRQPLQIGRRYGGLPVAISVDRRGVVNAVERHRYFGICRQPGAGTANDEWGVRFCAVNKIVIGNDADSDAGGGGIHRDRRLYRRRLVPGIGDAYLNVVIAIRQPLQHNSRHIHAPVTRRVHRCRGAPRAYSHRHHAARFGIGDAALQRLRGFDLRRIQRVIAGKRRDGHRRLRSFDIQRIGDLRSVARRVGGRHHNRVSARRKITEIGGRQRYLPVAVAAGGGGVGFAIERDGDRLPRFRAVAREHLIGRQLLRVQLAVIGHRIERERRRRGVDIHA